MKFSILFACCLALQLVLAEKQPFDRYQSILDRQMFGPLPPDFDPTKLPSEVSKSSSATEKQLTQEQEKLQSAIHFSMINVTPEGETEVGFTDNSDPKVPVTYLLKVGESRNGWTVKEADAVAATMTVAKGEIEVSLSLGGNSASLADATARSGGASAPASGATRPSGLGPGQRPGLLGGSLRARRLQRQQAAAADEAKRKEEQAAKDAERQAQAEQEKAQREAERAEQRQQLLAIQEELKRVREAKASAAKSDEEANADN